MIIDRYYYQQLSEKERIVYKVLYKGVMAHQDLIPLPVKEKLSNDSLQRIFSALTNDNPLIYFLNQSMYSYAMDQFGSVALCPQYFFSNSKVREYNRKIETVLSGLANQLQLVGETDYGKIKKVHDWMCRNVDYDYEGSNINNHTRFICSHNIIGVLAHHKAQCEGIAKAIKVILNSVDVKCIVATGEATDKTKTELHAWNIVKIKGIPYQLDVTWDIGHKDKKSNHITYDYFNINDELMYKTHKPSSILPRCNTLDENYFTKNGLLFRSKKQLLTYAEQMILQGYRELYFRVEGKVRVSVIANEVANHVSHIFTEHGKQRLRIRQIPNDILGTCWMKIG